MDKFKERLIALLWHAFFPNRCIFCQTVIRVEENTCEACRKELQFLDVSQCSRCKHRYCTCSQEGLPFVRVVVVFPYTEPHKEAIVELKFHHNRGIARPLGCYLAQQIENWRPSAPFDWVLSVPMSDKKKLRRGFNQAELIAQATAKELQIPYNGTLLVKVRETLEQHTLSRRGRQYNLRNAYRVSDPQQIVGKHILLVDDVYTTGATAIECAGMLLNYGAKTVVVGAVCKTVKREETQ